MRCLRILGLFLAGLPMSAVFSQEAGDPFPIRRMLVPSSKIASEIEKLNQGPTVVVPYDELQRRIAALAQPARSDSPHLIKASYTAELSGRSLINGRAQWTIRNSLESTWMPLSRLGLAVSKPRIDGADATLGESSGQPGLWLDRPGTANLTFDWSLRGTPSMSGLAFEFALPAAPVSTLELRLPGDTAPVSQQSHVLIAGPFDAETPKLRIWRLQVTGKGVFELLLRPTSVTAGSGSLIAAVEAVHTHQPALLNADFDWQIDVLHHPVQELTFEIDSRLQPYDVSIKGPEIREWQTREEKRDKGGPVHVLTLRFREPFVGSIPGCKIKCWAPSSPGMATNPGMRLRHAAGRNEKLTLVYHPDLLLESWEPGRFRLASSNAGIDQSLMLTLFDSFPNGPLETRPRYEFRSQEAAFAVTETNRWRLGPTVQSLDLDLRIDVSRGKLFQLALKLPAGKWKAEKVRTEPANLIRSWTVLGTTLLVDFKQGIDPKTDAKVLADLVSESSLDSSASELDFPDAEPMHAAVRIGTLAFEIDPVWNALVIRNSVPAAPALAAEEFRFEYRQEKIEGRLKLQARRVRPVIRLEQESVLGEGKQIHHLRLDVDPVGGAVKSVDVTISPPLPANAVWRGPDLGSVERLVSEEAGRVVAFAAMQNAWGALATVAAVPPAQIWRVKLREPLLRRSAVEWSIEASTGAEVHDDSRPWPLPVALPLHADRGDVKVSLRAQGETLSETSLWGLVPLAGAEVDRSALAWRVVGPTAFGPRVTVIRTARPAGPELQAVVDDARLCVSSEPDGRVEHYLSFEVRGWKQPAFPLVFPDADSDIVGVAIDGRWLPRPEIRNADGKLTVLIAAPSLKGSWRCEVAYSGKAPAKSHALSFRVDAIEPVFPAPTTGLRRQWRLPPDWMPLHQEDFSSWHRHKPGLDALRRWWTWGVQAVQPRNAGFHSGLRSLIAAEVAMRRQPSGERTLGDVLERLGSSVGAASLVIDAEAMRRLGLAPNSSISASAWNDAEPIWTSAGLIAVGVGDAVVLTSEAREAAWRANHGGDWSDALQASVAEAAARGQDVSGELQAVDAWTLKSPNAAPPRTLAFLGTSDLGGRWTEWSPLHGGPSAPWVAVSVSRVRSFAWLVAVALALAAWSSRRHFSSVSRFRCLWLMLTGMVFGSFWIPLSLRDLAFAPLVAAFGLLAVWHVSKLAGKAGRPAPTTLRRATPAKAAIAVMVAVVGTAASLGQGPLPFAVLIPTSEPNAAYVPTDLLRRLGELEAARNAAPLGPVVLQASYEGGRSTGDQFDFEAKFDVYAFEEKANWLLPLSGVDLKPGIFLDGAPVFPTPSPKGYVFVLPRKGSQRLTLSFVAKAIAAEGRQELRFGIPPAWSAHVQIQGADLGRDAAFVRCIGEDAVTTDAKGSVVRLKGDLGPENVVHVRWQANVAAPAAKTTIRERYLWDLRAGHVGLTGILQVDPGRPGMTKLELQLPPGLETRSLEVQTLAKSPVPLLKGWRSFDKGNSKWIAVELSQTAATPFRVVASWTPTFPIGAGRLELRMPYPANAAIAESLLGIAVENYEATDRPRNLGVTPLPPDTFGKLWLEGGGKETNVATKAYSFGREAGQATQGAMEVTLSPIASTVQAEVDWIVHPHFADVVATATWTSNDDLALLEAVVPPEIVLMDVQGAQVHRWSRKGDRVNVWLSQPRRQAIVRFVGWRKYGGGNEAKASLPAMRFLASQVQTQLRATASPGLSVRLDRAAGIKMQTAPADANWVAGNTESSTYELIVRIRREPQRLQWRLLTAAEAHDERGYLVQHIAGQLSHGEMPSFEIAAVSQHPMRLVLSGLGIATRLKSSAGEQRWLVKYPAGSGSSVSLSLRGGFSAPTGTRILVPEVKFSLGAIKSEVVAANGLTAASPTPSWTEAKADDGDLLSWKSAIPVAMTKGIGLWKRLGPDALTLQAASPPAAQNASVLGASRHWHMSEHGGWVCDEALLVAMQTTKSVEAVLPRGAQMMEAQIDGKVVVPLHVGVNRVRIDSETRGLHRVRILWKSDESGEIGPQGAGLVLVSRHKYPIAESIDLPSQWRSVNSAPLAAVWLSESRVLLEASRTLLDTPGDPLSERGQLLEMQGRLRSLLLWTKTRLSHSSGADLAEEWKHLTQENADLLKKHAMQVDAGDSFHGVSESSSATVGVPLLRVTMSDAPIPPANFIWEPDLSRPPLWILQAAALSFGLIFLVSFLPRGLTVWTALWPEQAALLLCVGFWLWGVSLIGAALIAFAVALRIALAVRLVRRGFARWWPTRGAAA